MKVHATTALVAGADGQVGVHVVNALLARGAARVYAAGPWAADVGIGRVVPLGIDLADTGSVADIASAADDVELVVAIASTAGASFPTDARSDDLLSVAGVEALVPVDVIRRLGPRLQAVRGAVVHLLIGRHATADPTATALASFHRALTGVLRDDLGGTGVSIVSDELDVDGAELTGSTGPDPGRVSRWVEKVLEVVEQCTGPVPTTPDLRPAEPTSFLDVIDIAFERIEPGQPLRGRLSVDQRHHTPWGIVHGGVWAAVIESAASVGASAAVADRGMFAAGLNNLTDFVRSTTAADVHVEATPLHVGSTTQFWAVDITSDDGKMVASGRVRLMNLPLDNAR